MLEVKGNAWTQYTICITTNGFINKKGLAVMGRGIALEARKRLNTLPKILAANLIDNGNHVSILRERNPTILSFPVKPVSRDVKDTTVVKHMRHVFTEGQVPGWACGAEIDIIKRSAEELMELIEKKGYKNVILPRPGCGSGELEWTDVKPIISKILDDRVTVITFDD